MTTEIFDQLPLSERTFMKHLKQEKYSFQAINPYHPCEWFIIVNGKEIGMVKYYRGRKLAAYNTKYNCQRLIPR